MGISEVDEDPTVDSHNLNDEYINGILSEVEEGTFGAARIRPSSSSESLNSTDEPSSEEKGKE